MAKYEAGFWRYANRIDELIVDGLPYKDNVKIAQALNNHFVSLANQSANVNESLLESAVLQSLFDIPEISANEIEKIIEQIPVSKATGPDCVGVKLIKAGAKAIAPSLSKLFNLCFSTATFPQIWKTAEVVPLFKNGDKTKADNYRPISILPVISKIIERHVHNTLMKDLQNRNLIYHLQSGFRRKYSTETALIRIVDQLLFSLDNDEVSGLLLVDFRKAFDMVNHQLLLNKLRAFGVGKSIVGKNTSKENLERIAKLQKRAARVILGASTRTRSALLFK